MGVPAERSSRRLFNTAGAALRLPTASLFAIGPAAPGPALRRGALVSLPVGLALVIELGFDSPTKGAVATGALLTGLPALDAPALPRAAWQAAVAVGVGLAAALGVLSGSSVALSVLAVALLGAPAGYCFAVSLRLAIAGLSVALALIIAQGLPLDSGDALPALVFGVAGGLLQAAFSFTVYLAGDRGEEPDGAWSSTAALAALRENLTLRSIPFRHGLRFGAALGVGVAAYWAIGMQEHGYWVPLTILFVLRPGWEETEQRLLLRAVGTVLGLVIATALSFWLHDDPVALALALTLASAFAYGLLTVQYALFTAAITAYAVLLADTLGEPALTAAAQRAGATAAGIAICALAFILWPNPGPAVE